MSLVSYNSIYLPYSQATTFEQDVVYNQDVDWYLTKYSITVQCLINGAYIAEISSRIAADTTNPARIMQIIRNKLMQPRKLLSYQVGGVEMIPQRLRDNMNATIQPGTVDAQNGPKPISCTYISLTNTTFLLQFAIEAHYWENNDPTRIANPLNKNLKSNPVLFNRWTESVDFDQSLYCTRTREGKYVIRSDNAEGGSADFFRASMASLALTPGCMRTVSRYKISPDGLGIDYTIVDKEVFRRPPPPAYEASGEYAESVADNGGLRRFCVATVRLRGSRTGQRQAVTPNPNPKAVLNPPLITNPTNAIEAQMQLFSVAVAIVSRKLRINGVAFPSIGNKNGTVLEGGYFKTDMYKNEVECMLKVSANPRTRGDPRDVRMEGWPAISFARGITATPFSDGLDYTPILPIRGTLPIAAPGLMLQTARYYDPNIASMVMNASTGQLTPNPPGTTIGTAGKTLEPDPII